MSEADPSDYDGGTAGGIRDDMTARSQLDPIVPAEAVELYFSHRQPDLSEKTLQNQRYRLQSFVEWCDENGVDNLNDLTGRDIYRFRSARLNDGVAKVTLAGVLQTLRVFLEFAAAIDAVPEGMRERVQLPETNPQEEASDEILEETFGGRAVVTTNPVTGAPSVTAVDTPVPDGETPRIHVLGHGTEAATTLARLVTAGCRCSAGVLPTGSVAAETADALDVEAVTTPAFRTAEDASVSSHRDRPFRGEHHVLDDAPQKYLRDPRSVSSTHDDLVDTSLVCRSDDLSGDTAVVDSLIDREYLPLQILGGFNSGISLRELHSVGPSELLGRGHVQHCRFDFLGGVGEAGDVLRLVYRSVLVRIDGNECSVHHSCIFHVWRNITATMFSIIGNNRGRRTANERTSRAVIPGNSDSSPYETRREPPAGQSGQPPA